MALDRQAERLIARGRKLTLLALAIMIAVEMVVLVVYNVSVGSEKLVQQLGRLLVSVFFAYFVFRGYRWARWLVVFLLVLGLIVLTPSVIGALRNGRIAAGMFLGSLAVAYLIAARLLIWSPGVSQFLKQQRSRGS